MPPINRRARRAGHMAELAIAVAAISTGAAMGLSPAQAQTPTPSPVAYEPTPAYRDYVVGAGETIKQVARASESPVDLIAELNNLSPPYMLHAGQKLIVPLQRTTEKDMSAAHDEPPSVSSSLAAATIPPPAPVVTRPAPMAPKPAVVAATPAPPRAPPPAATAPAPAPALARAPTPAPAPTPVSKPAPPAPVKLAQISPAHDAAPSITGAPATPDPVTGMPVDPRDLPQPGFAPHTVHHGETLWSIGQQAEASPELLSAINRAPNPRTLSPGKALTLPVRNAEQPAQPSRTWAALSHEVFWETDYDLHVVGPEETFWRIAHNAHVPVEQLAALNHLSPPYAVHLGQRLLLPNARMGAYWPLKAQPVATAPRPAPPRASAIGYSPRAAHTVILPVKDGMNYLGDVATTLSPDGSIAFAASDMLLAVNKALRVSAFERLRTGLSGKVNVSPEELKKLGLVAYYDPTALEIRLTIAASDRPSRSLDVATMDPSLIGKVETPANFSAFLNMKGSLDYVSSGTINKAGVQNPLVLLDGAARFKGFVLEGEGQYSNQLGVHQFARQGTRLIYDDQNWMARYTAGDLKVSTEGFQGGLDLGGLSVSRLYSELSPQENIRPRGDRAFVLTRDSTVETYINGRSVQQIRLPAGAYNMQNFPFVDGANDVRVVIQDDAGNTETLNFSIFFDRTLLKSGLTEFGAYAGALSEFSRGQPKYATNDVAFTGFWRHGFADDLTLGGNVQYDHAFRMVGVEGVWAPAWIGTLGIDAAYSDSDARGAGYAVNIGLNRLVQERASYRSQSLNLSMEMRSANFTTLGALTSTNPYTVQWAASYNRSFNQYVFAGLDLRYAAGRGTQKDVSSATASVGYRFDEFTNGSVNLSYADGGVLNGASLGFSITRRLGRARSVTGAFDTLSDEQKVSYVDNGGRGVGSWNTSADLEHSGLSHGNIGFNGAATYMANRAELGLAHSTSYDSVSGAVSDQRTTARVATSIAVADGVVGVGRPINDSFALFKPHSSLKGAQVVVDPTPQGALATSGPMGAGVLNDLSSYAIRTVGYDVPTAPTGYDIGQATKRVIPPYKSGYKVTVGSDYSLTIVGRLLDADGRPITLLAGKALDLDHPDHPPVTLFTSRDGRFAGEGLRAGRWRIEMPTATPTRFTFTIPASAGSLFRLNDITPDKDRP